MAPEPIATCVRRTVVLGRASREDRAAEGLAHSGAEIDRVGAGRMLRLVPMTAAEFQDSLDRGVERYAAEMVADGAWTVEASLAASRDGFDRLLPGGRETPGFRFCRAVDDDRAVGETWFECAERGGRPHFWVHWIWVRPELRRKGFARQLVDALEAEAKLAGADRVGLSVASENAGTRSLYERCGFVPLRIHLTKRLVGARAPSPRLTPPPPE